MKIKIVAYRIKKGKQLAIESQSSEKHSFNFHDIEFDDDISNSGKEPAALEVGTHKVQLEIVHVCKGKKKTSFADEGQSTASDKNPHALCLVSASCKAYTSCRKGSFPMMR
jgi:hypothetical protein